MEIGVNNTSTDVDPMHFVLIVKRFYVHEKSNGEKTLESEYDVAKEDCDCYDVHQSDDRYHITIPKAETTFDQLFSTSYLKSLGIVPEKADDTVETEYVLKYRDGYATDIIIPLDTKMHDFIKYHKNIGQQNNKCKKIVPNLYITMTLKRERWYLCKELTVEEITALKTMLSNVNFSPIEEPATKKRKTHN
jgi:hypothetical protein